MEKLRNSSIYFAFIVWAAVMALFAHTIYEGFKKMENLPDYSVEEFN